MIEINYGYYKEGTEPKLHAHIDWFFYESSWHVLYHFDRLRVKEEDIEYYKKRNRNRYKKFYLQFNICGAYLDLDIKLKKVGLCVNGKLRDDGPQPVPNWMLKNREKARLKKNMT